MGEWKRATMVENLDVQRKNKTARGCKHISQQAWLTKRHRQYKMLERNSIHLNTPIIGNGCNQRAASI